MFENRHMFFGSLNGINLKDFKIDKYNITSLKERKKIVEEKVKELEPFLEKYFSGEVLENGKEIEFFKSELNQNDELSENNNICKALENMANYLLGSEEVRSERKKDKQAYNFYIDKTEFRNKVLRNEDYLDGIIQFANNKIGCEKEENNGNNIIDFMYKQTNTKKSKKITISKDDYEKDDLCSEVLREYKKSVDEIDKKLLDIRNNKDSKYKGKRYILTKLKKDIHYDMVYCKQALRKIDKPRNLLRDSTSPDFDKFDWKNEKHIKALLFVIKELEPCDDLSNLVLSLEILVEDMILKNKLTVNEICVYRLIREGYNITEIKDVMDLTQPRISAIVKSICKKISK